MSPANIKTLARMVAGARRSLRDVSIGDLPGDTAKEALADIKGALSTIVDKGDLILEAAMSNPKKAVEAYQFALRTGYTMDESKRATS